MIENSKKFKLKIDLSHGFFANKVKYINIGDCDFSYFIENGSVVAVNCGDPGQINFATRTGTDFSEGRTVSYTCAFCYVGGGAITCQNGRWSALPQCRSKLSNTQYVAMLDRFFQWVLFHHVSAKI